MPAARKKSKRFLLSEQAAYNTPVPFLNYMKLNLSELLNYPFSYIISPHLMRKFLTSIVSSITILIIVVFCMTLRADPEDIDLNGAKLLSNRSGGAKEYELSDGSVATIYPDGSARRIMPDGRVIFTWPRKGTDEIKRIKFTNGQVESYYADGTKKILQPNGNELWIFPDGMQREKRADGSVLESVLPRQDLVDPDVVALSPWPRFVKPFDRVVFSGELRSGYNDPWACVLLPGGSLIEIPKESFNRQGAKFSVSVIMSDGPGIYRVEIIAKGIYGNKVAMNVTLWSGIEPEKEDTQPTLYRTVDPLEDLSKIEYGFFEMLNRERTQRNIKPVIWELETAQLARNTSREMTDRNYFGHISPRNGNLAQRAVKLFKWSRIAYGMPPSQLPDDAPNYIADDLIRARSLGGAMATLLESPAHRKVILFPGWTHCGVGSSRIKGGDGREVVIVIAMAQLNHPKHRPPPKPKPPPPDRDE